MSNISYKSNEGKLFFFKFLLPMGEMGARIGGPFLFTAPKIIKNFYW